MDKGTYYTHALARLGDHNDVNGSDEHTACEMFAQHAIALCLDYTRWSWATIETTLTLTNGTAQLPPDCLRLHTVSLPTYQIHGRTIHADGATTAASSRHSSNGATADITYTTSTFIDTVSLPDYEPTFCEACILMLAAIMAPRLTNNLNLADKLKQEAYSRLHAAKVKDARISDSNDQTPEL